MRDNPETWLAFTDLVMIDPVGTGWSRAAKADGAKAFYGVQSDADSLAKVVALYLSKNRAAPRPSSSWARATAASAPPRWRARCSTSRA